MNADPTGSTEKRQKGKKEKNLQNANDTFEVKKNFFIDILNIKTYIWLNCMKKRVTPMMTE